VEKLYGGSARMNPDRKFYPALLNLLYINAAMRCAVLVVLFCGLAAQAQDCTQVIPAILVNEETHEAVPSMTADRLHAKAGKLAIPITALEPIKSFRVLILIDASGSMDPTNTPFTHRREALEVLNKALDELLDQLPPHVRLEYGVFNKNAAFGPEFTADGHQLRRSLVDSTERAKGNRFKETALYDAVKEALERFDSPQPGDSILMLTDGGDNVSHANPEKIEEEAARRGVRLFTVLLLGGKSASSPSEGTPQEMFDFAERTGGSVHVIDASNTSWIYAKEQEKAKQEFRQFWTNAVLSGYLVHLKVPADGGKQRKWLLAVDRLPGQKNRILLAYPSRLPSCSLQSLVR
jgi:hypothetical protein